MVIGVWRSREPLQNPSRRRIVRSRAVCRVDFLANSGTIGCKTRLAAHPDPNARHPRRVLQRFPSGCSPGNPTAPCTALPTWDTAYCVFVHSTRYVLNRIFSQLQLICSRAQRVFPFRPAVFPTPAPFVSQPACPKAAHVAAFRPMHLCLIVVCSPLSRQLSLRFVVRARGQGCCWWWVVLLPVAVVRRVRVPRSSPRAPPRPTRLLSWRPPEPQPAHGSPKPK